MKEKGMRSIDTRQAKDKLNTNKGGGGKTNDVRGWVYILSVTLCVRIHVNYY